MTVFDVNEVYRFAVRIEENGETFYRQAAQKMEDPGMKRFTPAHQHASLDMIVDEERGHLLKLSELKRTSKPN